MAFVFLVFDFKRMIIFFNVFAMFSPILKQYLRFFIEQMLFKGKIVTFKVLLKCLVKEKRIKVKTKRMQCVIELCKKDPRTEMK